MTFKELGVIEPILRALSKKGYKNPTPIQERSIPILLDKKDLLGCAQTGTGKTAAFTIPILQHMHLEGKQDRGAKIVKTLIVTPTRELAIQINENIKDYAEFTRLRSVVIFGGVKQGAQTNALRRGVDIIVATPGRLLDLIGQGYITLKHIEYFVLDEADQMLDMGFIHDIKKLIAMLPHNRQSLFFSATMPRSIVDLSKKILGDHEKVTIKPEQATAEKVEQVAYHVAKRDKTKLLIHLLELLPDPAVLVFSRTKHGADKIVKQLDKAGIKAAAIHGNKSQAARQRALKAFKEGKLRALIATDIAARGIDIQELSLVVNYDLPNVPETYVHRIGRTGRAEASGVAISFCNGEERPYLKDIQKLIKQDIPIHDENPYEDDLTEPPTPKQKQRQPRSNRRSNGGGNSNNRNSRRDGNKSQGGGRRTASRRSD